MSGHNGFGLSGIAIISLFFSACSPTKTSTPNAPNPPSHSTNSASAEVNEGEELTHGGSGETSLPQGSPAIAWQLVDAEGLTQMVASHQGSVVLVDCWAMWCHTCLEEFPRTVALHDQLHERGLVVIGLNFDSPDSAASREGAERFLVKQGATFTQLQSSVTPGTKAMEAFDIAAGLPHFRLYDSSGKLVATFDEAPEDWAAVIEPLLPR